MPPMPFCSGRDWLKGQPIGRRLDFRDVRLCPFRLLSRLSLGYRLRRGKRSRLRAATYRAMCHGALNQGNMRSRWWKTPSSVRMASPCMRA